MVLHGLNVRVGICEFVRKMEGLAYEDGVQVLIDQ